MSQFKASPRTSSNKVATYVHSGNIEVRASSVNLETGVFTSSEILPWDAGTKVYIMTVVDIHENGILPIEFDGLDEHAIEIIDEYSFYLLKGGENGSRMTFQDPKNISVDVSKFHFEEPPANLVIDMTELKTKHVWLRFRGCGDRPGWRYARFYINHKTGSYSNDIGLFADGRDAMAIEINMSINVEYGYLSAQYRGGLKTLWNNSLQTFSYSETDASSGDGFFKKFEEPILDYVSFDFNYSNGSVVEIFDMEGRQ